MRTYEIYDTTKTSLVSDWPKYKAGTSGKALKMYLNEINIQKPVKPCSNMVVDFVVTNIDGWPRRKYGYVFAS